MESARHRIGCLDGLRAVAIFLVIISHLFVTPGVPDWLHAARLSYAILDIGLFGVHLFFVISGFIITHLLVREEQRFGGISLRDFWGRRALRILPPLFAFLLVVALLARFSAIINPQPIEFVMALTFTQKILSPFGTWWLGHTWSLSIEEQFYVLWPLVFLVPRNYRTPVLLVWSLLLMPVASLLTTRNIPEQAGWIMPAHQGYIVAGCLLAFYRHRRAGHDASLRPPWFWFVAACGLVFLPQQLVRFAMVRPMAEAFGSIVGGAGIAILLLLMLDGAFPRLSDLLNQTWIAWIGRISYTLYLWQQIFLGPWGGHSWQRFPQNLAALAVTVLAFHWWVERPFLRMKDRLFARS